jgi:hypothetical protein
MGFSVPRPDFRAGEAVQWSPLANRDQNGRAVGGRLYVTETRMLFQPNRVDAMTGGKTWTCALESVASVGVAPPDGKPFSGGIRTRLRVEVIGGDVERFVIRHLDESVERMRTLISASGTYAAEVNEDRSPSLRNWIITGLLLAGGAGFFLLNAFVFH